MAGPPGRLPRRSPRSNRPRRRNVRAEDLVGDARRDAREQLNRWAARPRRPAARPVRARLAGRAGRGRRSRPVSADAATLKEATPAATTTPHEPPRWLAELRARRLRWPLGPELDAERARIAAERDDAPPPATPGPAPRAGRPGAPLWRLVRFAEPVAPARAAGIEAALHAAGLLDAWAAPRPQPAPLPHWPVRGAGRLPGGVAASIVARTAGPWPTCWYRRSRPTCPQSGSGPSGVGRSGRTWSTLGRWRWPTVGRRRAGTPRASASAGSPNRAASTSARPPGPPAGSPGIADATAAGRARRQIADRRPGPAAIDRAACPLWQAAAEAVAAAHRAYMPRCATSTAQRSRCGPGRRRGHRERPRLDQALAERAVAAAALQSGRRRRSSPSTALDAVAPTPWTGSRSAGVRLDAAHPAASRAAAAEAGGAAARRDEAVDRSPAAEDAARRMPQPAPGEGRGALRTLRRASAAEADRVLADAAQTADEITVAERTPLPRPATAAAPPCRSGPAPAARVELGEQAVAAAVGEARHEAQRLRPYRHADLLGLMRCPTGLRWPRRRRPGRPNSIRRCPPCTRRSLPPHGN